MRHPSWHINESLTVYSLQNPQMEEIGLKTNTPSKISTHFHGSPHTFQTSFHRSPLMCDMNSQVFKHSRHAYKFSHMRRSPKYEWVANLNESCFISHVTYERVTSRMYESKIRIASVTNVNESCVMTHVTCEWVTSHMNQNTHRICNECEFWTESWHMTRSHSLQMRCVFWTHTYASHHTHVTWLALQMHFGLIHTWRDSRYRCIHIRYR